MIIKLVKLVNTMIILREEINMADYKEPGNRCGGYDR